MDERKRKKRRHDSDTSDSNSDGVKSRKTDRKNLESRQNAIQRTKKKSRDKNRTSSSGSVSEHSGGSDLESKKKKRKHPDKEKLKRRKEKRKRKREKKERKRKRRKEKGRTTDEVMKEGVLENTSPQAASSLRNKPGSSDPGCDPAPKKRSMVPMTKEEYEKQQAEVRRVYDPETGRHRLVKGTGEILEEIVSRDRHKAINKTATQGDGAFFQVNLGLKDK